MHQCRFPHAQSGFPGSGRSDNSLLLTTTGRSLQSRAMLWAPEAPRHVDRVAPNLRRSSYKRQTKSSSMHAVNHPPVSIAFKNLDNTSSASPSLQSCVVRSHILSRCSIDIEIDRAELMSFHEWHGTTSDAAGDRDTATSIHGTSARERYRTWLLGRGGDLQAPRREHRNQVRGLVHCIRKVSHGRPLWGA
jgi:hypothetical protein